MLAILTYSRTLWSRVLLEKLTGSAASQKIPRIFGTRRFITVLTSARHLSLSWANSIQFWQPPPTSRRSILILSSHARLGPCYPYIYVFPSQDDAPLQETNVLVRNLNLDLPGYETAKPISWPTSRHSLIHDNVALFVKFVGKWYTSVADPLGTIMYCTGPALFVIREEPQSKTQSIRGGEYFTPNQARHRDVCLLQVT